MERRYRETESNSVREELIKFVSTKPCSGCNGSRLRLEARNVFIADTTLPQISEMSIIEALEFFKHLSLAGQRAQIADKILKEICDRLNFLVNVGLNYLNLSRSAETVGGEKPSVSAWPARLVPAWSGGNVCTR